MDNAKEVVETHELPVSLSPCLLVSLSSYLLFAVTVTLNAFLLFAVEPLVARLILPLLGGTPAVWNTCMVFFQAVLLAGYAAAHGLSRRLPLRTQAVVYPWLLLPAFLVLPVGLGDNVLNSVPREGSPIPWLLGLLTVVVGMPFFALATTGPLLQKWFAGTDHPAAKDPYFLYAASNLGSMAALISYPLLVEPRLHLTQQSWLWAAGYWLLAALILCCAMRVDRARRAESGPAPDDAGGGEERLSLRRRLRWVALAFVPSSLLLGVTTYLSTDIATIPLLWIVPLALYLLTFILVFARRPIVSSWLVGRVLPIGILVLLVLLMAEGAQPPILVTVTLHLLVFFVAGLFCHGQLARDRPSPRYLTEFYLWLATGGVLGGLFNALVAPLVFHRVLEYPLMLIALALLRPAPATDRAKPVSRWLDYLLPAALGGLTAALILGWPRLDAEVVRLITRLSGIKPPSTFRLGILFGLPAILCYCFEPRRLRFALGIAAIMAAGVLYAGGEGRPLHTERSFFGVLRVTVDANGKFYQLVHGNTIHGRELIRLPEGQDRHEPLSYYHRRGPIGDVFAKIRPRFTHARVGVVGLGVGATAWYAEPDEDWTFYEIDPAVKRLASDTTYFTYLSECRARKLDVVLGDARLSLRDAPDHQFQLLVLDAFSSDAVPVHLLTREALALYRSKLAPGGVLAFHTSNRFLDLRPVLANLARDAGLVCRCRDDLAISAEEVAQGRDPSQWVVMAGNQADLGKLARNVFWDDLLKTQAPGPVWTDDYSNIIGIFKWFDWERD